MAIFLKGFPQIRGHTYAPSRRRSLGQLSSQTQVAPVSGSYAVKLRWTVTSTGASTNIRQSTSDGITNR